ncbi:MAG: hypothetical protein ABI364_02785, partial [Caldimonas sp.]
LASKVFRTVALVVALPLIVAAFLWMASALGDSSRVPAELAAAGQEAGVMVCNDGRIVHGSDSLLDRMLAVGDFRCTSWKMRGKQSDPATGTVNWPSSPRR